MKRKIAIAFATVTLLGAAIVTLCSFTSHNEVMMDAGQHTHVSCQGKHCDGTVGCNCPGFSPIKDGKVWQESYCKHCGHHKSSHK